MTIQTWILLAVTLCSFLLSVDGWVHRRETREKELDYRADGQPSLKVQIDTLRSDWRRSLDDMEKMRLERAATLAQELAAMHASLMSLHGKASDHGTEMQKTFSRMNERVIVLEGKMDTVVEILDRRRR